MHHLLNPFYSLLVQETLQYFPIQICALKEKEPTFIELTRKIERIMNTNVNKIITKFFIIHTHLFFFFSGVHRI